MQHTCSYLRCIYWAYFLHFRRFYKSLLSKHNFYVVILIITTLLRSIKMEVQTHARNFQKKIQCIFTYVSQISFLKHNPWELLFQMNSLFHFERISLSLRNCTSIKTSPLCPPPKGTLSHYWSSCRPHLPLQSETMKMAMLFEDFIPATAN